jgi:hypothetical protein
VRNTSEFELRRFSGAGERGYSCFFPIDSLFDRKIAIKSDGDGGLEISAVRLKLHDGNGSRNSREPNKPQATTKQTRESRRPVYPERRSPRKNSNGPSVDSDDLVAEVRAAIPTPLVVVNTGGNAESRIYSGANVKNEQNTFTKSPVSGNACTHEKQEKIAAIDELIAKLQTIEGRQDSLDRAMRQLSKARDELSDCVQPDESAIARWVERAKDAMTGIDLGARIAELAMKLWGEFGIKC